MDVELEISDGVKFVLNIPSNNPYIVAEWNEINGGALRRLPCKLQIVKEREKIVVLVYLLDGNNRPPTRCAINSFNEEDSAVKPVKDHKFGFVLKIEDGDSRALAGLIFEGCNCVKNCLKFIETLKTLLRG